MSTASRFSEMLSPRLICPGITKSWIQDPTSWSPHRILSGDASIFPSSLRMSVKRSLTSRFFMYEEHMGSKLKDDRGSTEILERSPQELADLLCEKREKTGGLERHHYWTSPIMDVAPSLLERMKGYTQIHGDGRLLDPRGPSLWMGSSGSATQAHYDVADNVIVQLFGSKRIRCFSPKAASALHVFPDAHPRARKSQVNFDTPDYDTFPNFSLLPHPVIDVELLPGDSIFIPAFWFHHVENGTQERKEQLPSVSMNLFAISKSMMKAQSIFIDASQPFGSSSLAVDPLAALNALTCKLFDELEMNISTSSFIKSNILDARYAPLQSKCNDNTIRIGRRMSASEEKLVSDCIARLKPQFLTLRDDGYDEGVFSLVLCHLIELWAVEMVGAPSVAILLRQLCSLDNTRSQLTQD